MIHDVDNATFTWVRIIPAFVGAFVAVMFSRLWDAWRERREVRKRQAKLHPRCLVCGRIRFELVDGECVDCRH